MAKTNPIGVRFDKDLLLDFKEDKLAETPQGVLNFLADFYRLNGKKTDPVPTKGTATKKIKFKKPTKKSFDGPKLNITNDEPKQWEEEGKQTDFMKNRLKAKNGLK
jgi:hypothetical protein